jgi:hypothetical protein
MLPLQSERMARNDVVLDIAPDSIADSISEGGQKEAVPDANEKLQTRNRSGHFRYPDPGGVKVVIVIAEAGGQKESTAIGIMLANRQFQFATGF